MTCTRRPVGCRLKIERLQSTLPYFMLASLKYGRGHSLPEILSFLLSIYARPSIININIISETKTLSLVFIYFFRTKRQKLRDHLINSLPLDRQAQPQLVPISPSTNRQHHVG